MAFGDNAFGRQRRQRRRAPETGIGGVFGGGSDYGFRQNRLENFRPRNVGSPFDPTYNYGSPWGNRNQRLNAGLNTGIGNYLINRNPESYFRLQASRGGLETNSQTLMGRFFQNQMGDMMQGYEQALLRNPYLTVQDYWKTTGGVRSIRDQWRLASPQARGENLGMSQGTLQWQMGY